MISSKFRRTCDVISCQPNLGPKEPNNIAIATENAACHSSILRSLGFLAFSMNASWEASILGLGIADAFVIRRC